MYIHKLIREPVPYRSVLYRQSIQTRCLLTLQFGKLLQFFIELLSYSQKKNHILSIYCYHVLKRNHYCILLATLDFCNKLFGPNCIRCMIQNIQNMFVSVNKFIKEDQLPHLLFYGPPGTGKTSTILACARQMYKPSQFSSMVNILCI